MKGNVLLALCDTCSDWVSNDLSTRASPGIVAEKHLALLQIDLGSAKRFDGRI